ncbi:MAG: cobalt ECF transporter T component CbiQ [Lachnospiraceae bacterium]
MQMDYYAYRSGMRHWHAGVKAALAVGTLCMVLLANRLLVSLLVILSMTQLTLWQGKVKWKEYWHLLRIPLVFISFQAFMIAIIFARQPIGEWNIDGYFMYLCLTRESLWSAGRVFCKAMAGMSAVYMLALSTPMYELILVLQKLHLPKLMIELMHLIYRYLFILLEVAEQMQISAQSRMGYHNFRSSCKSFAGIGANLFLISLQKANSYYDALLARGYDGTLTFLTENKEIRMWQIMGMILYFIMLTGIAMIR